MTAILVEPVLGEGGINIPADDYLNQLRELCDANDWLLMLDEIQTGMGRSGRMFSHQHNGILPDVMSLAKGWATAYLSALAWREALQQKPSAPATTAPLSVATR